MKQIALAIILFWTCSLIYKILIDFDSSVMEVDEILVVPNLTYWFGRDDFGRDIYLRLIDGFINSFQIILSVTLITSISGILIGVLSGYLGGRLDQVIKFVTTLFMSFPGILLAIAFAAILSPGKLNLIIPVVKHPNHTALQDIKISYDHTWQKQHWKSIASSYRSSPYFEFYEDDFAPIFLHHYETLVEFNLALQNKVLEALGIKLNATFSKEHVKEIEGFDNHRSYFTPKDKSLDFPKEPYNQVFEDKCGFIPNLFIFDLLFNEGPNAISFL